MASTSAQVWARRTVPWAVLAILPLVVSASGAGPAAAGGRRTTSAVAAVAARPSASPRIGRGPTARIIFQVPEGTEDPAWALSGGSGNQAWYWTPDGDSTIYEVNAATHRQLAYHLGTSCSVSCARAYPGLAVAPDGIVWGAVNHTLVRLDPATGRFTTIALVPPPPSVGEDNTDISNTAQSATTVAVGGRRQEVAIGFEFGSEIEVYTPGNPGRPPRIIALPSGFITNDVAILPDDTIGVVMQRFGAQPDPEIDVIASDGSSRHLRVPDCWGIEADGTAGLPRRRVLRPGAGHRVRQARARARQVPAAERRGMGSQRGRWTAHPAHRATGPPCGVASRERLRRRRIRERNGAVPDALGAIPVDADVMPRLRPYTREINDDDSTPLEVGGAARARRSGSERRHGRPLDSDEHAPVERRLRRADGGATSVSSSFWLRGVQLC